MKPFNLKETLESGQIFRFEYIQGGARIAHGQHIFEVYNDETHTHEDDTWVQHFFRSDQPELEHNHPYVQEAIENTQGVRILRQDPWECLVAFIVSQNNHQKRIQANIFSIAKTFGKPLRNGMHAFPQPHELGDEEDFRELGLGYRAKHLAQLKELDLDWYYGLADVSYEQAKKELQTLSGVGPKVADCILLFGLGFDEACPEDTWIKKIFTKHSITRDQLGEQAGLYQQMLFHYTRSS